jgi:hypothetical protein
MQVHNDQDCVLVIGDVRIKGGESKTVTPDWEARVQQLADAKALRIHGGPMPDADDRPSRAMSPAELFAAMSPDDQRAAIERVGHAGTVATKAPVTSPAEVSEDVAAALRSEYRKAAEGMTEPTGAPADFATCHVNKAKAWVNKCSDADLLARLGNEENRVPVLETIMARIAVLRPDETKAN